MTYDPAKYPTGSKVRIVDRAALERFANSWTAHHKLERRQLDHAGTVADVAKSYMYHGGDILYELHDVPGIWHEQCLQSARKS